MNADDHIWSNLALIEDTRRRQELAEEVYQALGDKALEMHPASILAITHQLLTQPLSGQDGFDDLRWSISSPAGLPTVRVDLVCFNEAHDHFETTVPSYAEKVRRDFEASAGNDVSGMVYSYLTEDLDENDRSAAWLGMAQDAQTFAGRFVDALKIRGWEGWGPVLRDAAERGDLRAVKDSLAIGISPNQTDALGNSPLHLAAGNGHGLLIQPLIEAGADPNGRNQDGKTPLHLAADGRWAVACLNLMACGAAPDARDNRGRIPSARKHVQVFAPSL